MFLTFFARYLVIMVVVIVVVLLAMTPRAEMHSASFIFGSEGMINNAEGWGPGVAFLFGLLSVQWTVSRSAQLTHLRHRLTQPR